jgi:uncharacterized protein (UPF0332 family)
MDKAVIAQTVADEVGAAEGCLAAAMNGLAGPYGRTHARSVSDLYYACYHLAAALLASKGIAAATHEAVHKLIALHFVKPAALPADTVARLNELMDKRHVADYKPYIPITGEDISRFRPWVAAFARRALKLLDKSAPARRAKSLLELVAQFEKLAI